MIKNFVIFFYICLLLACRSEADKPEAKNDDAALLQAMGVKTEPTTPQTGLQVEVAKPKFDENKPQIEITAPAQKGSSLDY